MLMYEILTVVVSEDDLFQRIHLLEHKVLSQTSRHVLTNRSEDD